MNDNTVLAFVVALGVIVSAIMMLFQDTVVLLLAPLLYIIVCICIVKLDIMHPVTWFLPFFYLYHFSILLLQYFGVKDFLNYKIVVEITWYSIFLNSLIFILFCPREYVRHKIQDDALCRVYNLLYVAFFLFVVYLNYSFYDMGLVSKTDSSETNMKGVYSFMNWMLVFYTLLLGYKLSNKHKINTLMISAGLLSLFTALNLGERDVFFTFLLVTMLIVDYYRPISRFMLVAIATASMIAIPILGAMKNVFYKDSINFSNANYLVALADGEFRSAGFNLSYIIDSQKSWHLRYGGTLIDDLMRSLVPSFIANFKNPTGWYNQTYFPEIVAAGRGYGFSVLAEGYINAGAVGAILWSFLLAMLIVLLYRGKCRSFAGMVIYVMSIPICIYAIRGDFSTILSPLFKNILCPIFMSYCLSIFFVRGKRSNNFSIRGRV
ncbi:hypothetical protein GEOBRER4_n2623 [Citrifermentans bremense]|uniref:O-antigen polysaccharide polymerase Wzy n=1 Tax=Citrifermentans bremense TaxID=60035 RepID=A0A7R7FTH4_9BACT|nr:O-antigen polysaccharide polymerase Wzy [Citrifermentans bremense]BCO11453.1 hypothetical protein GEOBRER4_n2623 [Citrifermentans bremense]